MAIVVLVILVLPVLLVLVIVVLVVPALEVVGQMTRLLETVSQQPPERLHPEGTGLEMSEVPEEETPDLKW